MDITAKDLNERATPFSKHLGINYLDTTPNCVRAEMLVKAEHCTFPNVMHGGAVMALADGLGAVGTVLNMPAGSSTTTLESKTNFLAAIPEGQTAQAECTPVHLGRTTMVWRTEIRRDDGKLAAVVTQTQLVMKPS